MIFFIYFCQIHTREVLIVSLNLFTRLLICAHFCSYVLMSRFLLVWLLLTVCFHPWAFQRKRICLTAPLRSAPLWVYLFTSTDWIFPNLMTKLDFLQFSLMNSCLRSRYCVPEPIFSSAHLCSFVLISAHVPIFVCLTSFDRPLSSVSFSAWADWPNCSAPLRSASLTSPN